ncbi:MAG: tol-pal system protein YbgF [Syntrophales bacterium]|nr:tol-pal system protein YbgF [Syntrophales bacterium]
MKNCLSFFLLVCLIAISGCATPQGLKQVRGELVIVDETVKTIELKTLALKEELEKKTEAITTLRKGQAGVGADITELRDHIQQLKGIVEGLRKDILTMVQQANRRDEEYKVLREKLDNISFKINFIESFLGISKKSELGEVAAGRDRQGVSPPSKDAIKGKADRESVYAAAYETFKEGKYEKARTEFQNFLKQFSDTEYSDNAQFWIGECYYLEKKYEKAILEYEKVAKNYPQGNKVPYALLKQGFSFLELGDKSSARIILQQVIKDYPHTNQARIARAKLMEIK